ncbi:amidohydrolase family protein [Streptomyces sp. NPDC031705]|uniref:metal-dependent hydrolase family protein n=1 Tax=Streptomyces sp. NPDC031705 TaxID=3155729 RepID=UPI0033CF14C3
MTRRLILADRLVNAVGDGVVRAAAVVVEDGLITWAGRRADLGESVHESAEVLDLGARSLLPGLIDAHVHLGFDGGPAPVETMTGADDEELTALMLSAAGRCLEAGITTVRDLGSRGATGMRVRELLAAGTAPGPRVLAAGRPITTPGGHCWYMGGACADRDGLLAEVDRNHAEGADLIKIMATGGFLTAGTTPGAPQFDEDALRAVVHRAKELGLRVAAHAHGTAGIAMAVAAGVDTVEHCSWVGTGGGLEFDPRVAERMAAQGVSVCPTVNRNARNPHGRLPWGPRAEHIAALHRAGVAVVAGTDAGIEHIPHDDLATGLEILRDAGLTPREVIRSATSVAAAALGIADRTGSIREGLSADLIAVDRDPTADVGALAAPSFVMLRGRPVRLPGPGR